MSSQRRSRAAYSNIRRVVDRMSKLADSMEAFKPDTTVLTLWRADLNLIRGDPETAALFQITVPSVGPPRWRKYTLTTVQVPRQ